MVVHRQRERRGRASVAVSAGEPPVARLRMPLEWLGNPTRGVAVALVASRPWFAVWPGRGSDRHLRASAVFAQLSRALAAANFRRRSPPWQVPGRPSKSDQACRASLSHRSAFAGASSHCSYSSRAAAARGLRLRSPRGPLGPWHACRAAGSACLAFRCAHSHSWAIRP